MDLYTIVAKRNSSGKARYNEEAYNQIILQNFNYDQYMLNHIPARRLVRHLGLEDAQEAWAGPAK